MNLHAPQSLQARAECELLMSVKKMLITPQSNHPVMGILQDTLVGAYLFTREDVWCTWDEVQQIMYHVPEWDGNVPTPAILKPPLWSGKQLFSCLLPTTLHIDAFNVLIRNGYMVSGHLGKKILGRSHGSLIHILVKDYGHERASIFFHHIQKMIDFWLMHRGFSTGMGDCMITDELDAQLDT